MCTRKIHSIQRKPVESLQSSLWHDSFAPFIRASQAVRSGRDVVIHHATETVITQRIKQADGWATAFPVLLLSHFGAWSELKHPGNLSQLGILRLRLGKKNQKRRNIAIFFRNVRSCGCDDSWDSWKMMKNWWEKRKRRTASVWPSAPIRPKVKLANSGNYALCARYSNNALNSITRNLTSFRAHSELGANKRFRIENNRWAEGTTPCRWPNKKMIIKS